ncbi:MAG: hypothetical protein HYV93_03350 [Candidatus Rokubacteria bacterium]|nr:hypothetical protein [Candidatus Rokubacteria bacterium]
MAVMDRLEQRNGAAPLGIGLVERIGRAWRGSHREEDAAAQAPADPHRCQWRQLAYASLPITEESPGASTLMIEGCCLCPAVRSGVVAGRWVPGASGELVRVGGVAPARMSFPPAAEAGGGACERQLPARAQERQPVPAVAVAAPAWQ